MRAGEVALREVLTKADMALAFAIREVVFILEQSVPLDEEVDGLDERARHVLLEVDGLGVGTGRVLPPSGPGMAGGAYHLGRIAVLKEWRGQGLGTVIVRALEALSLADLEAKGGHGQVEVDLAAQTHALGFYRRLGYTVHGRTYPDAAIDHRDAIRLVRREDTVPHPTPGADPPALPRP